MADCSDQQGLHGRMERSESLGQHASRWPAIPFFMTHDEPVRNGDQQSVRFESKRMQTAKT
jgi:hypothetical protein